MMIKTKLKAACYIVKSSITDHECTILNLNLQSSQLLNTFDKIRKHVDYINLDIAMNNLDLKCIFNIGDLHLAAEFRIKSLRRALEGNTRLSKVSKIKQINKLWITVGLLRCMRNRDNLPKKLKKYPENEVLKNNL